MLNLFHPWDKIPFYVLLIVRRSRENIKILSHSWNKFRIQRQNFEYPLYLFSMMAYFCTPACKKIHFNM